MSSVITLPEKPINPLMRNTLAPLSRHYEDPTTVEIRMGQPGLVVTERRGEGKKRVEDPAITLATIETIARALANSNGLLFHPDENPKLSCILDDGHRFECMVGPSSQNGLSLAIRCKHPFTPTWEQVGITDWILEYLLEALGHERNLIVSGATNTGKTTLLNMLLGTLDAERRVVAMEDTPELHIDRFWDGVGLVAAREADQGSGMIDWRGLYDHMVRITPDHIIFGEISTGNAFAALAALNSGVTGFMCTIHAESPQQAIHRKFDQNIAWSGGNMTRVAEFLSELVDVVVQIKRRKDGWRRVTDIFEPRNDRWILRDGKGVS